MVARPEAVLQIALYPMVILPDLPRPRERVYGLPGAAVRPVPVTAPQDVRLEDRREDARHRPLQPRVFPHGNPQGP